MLGLDERLVGEVREAGHRQRLGLVELGAEENGHGGDEGEGLGVGHGHLVLPALEAEVAVEDLDAGVSGLSRHPGERDDLIRAG